MLLLETIFSEFQAVIAPAVADAGLEQSSDHLHPATRALNHDAYLHDFHVIEELRNVRVNGVGKPRICEIGGEEGMTGMPWGGNQHEETHMDLYPRGFLYGAFLLYLLCGLSCAADLLMEAVEAVTSKRRLVKLQIVDAWGDKQERFVAERSWHPTIANLTLMSLGAAAPEIMLATIELLGKDYQVTSTITGEVSLGPNVIIGSAAFNLTVVLAACILAVPAGEIRKVVHRDSYVVLTIFAFLGPAWLLLILRATSPHVVRVFEAILTFLYFPWLVMLVFFADKGMIPISFMLSAPDLDVQRGTFAAKQARDELNWVKKVVHDSGILRSLNDETPEDAANYVLHYLQRQAVDLYELRPSEVYDVVLALRRKMDADRHVDLAPHDHDACNEDPEHANSSVKGEKKTRAEYRMEACKHLTAKKIPREKLRSRLVAEQQELAASVGNQNVHAVEDKALVSDFHAHAHGLHMGDKVAAKATAHKKQVAEMTFADRKQVFKKPPAFVPHRHQLKELQNKVVFEMGAATDFAIVPEGQKIEIEIPVVRQVHLGSTKMALPPAGFDDTIRSSVRVNALTYDETWLQPIQDKEVRFKKTERRYHGKVEILKLRLDGSQKAGSYVDLTFDECEIWDDVGDLLQGGRSYVYATDDHGGENFGPGGAREFQPDTAREPAPQLQPAAEGEAAFSEEFGEEDWGEDDEPQSWAPEPEAEGAHYAGNLSSRTSSSEDAASSVSSSFTSSSRRGEEEHDQEVEMSVVVNPIRISKDFRRAGSSSLEAPERVEMTAEQTTGPDWRESNAHCAEPEGEHLEKADGSAAVGVTNQVTAAEVQLGDVHCISIVNSHPVCRIYVVPEEEYEARSGEILFCDEQTYVPGSKYEQEITTYALRVHGNAGECVVHYHTEKASALPNVDYRPIMEGEIWFEEGQTVAPLTFSVIARHPFDHVTDYFYLVMDNIELLSRDDDDLKWPTFSHEHDGGEDANVMTVYVLPDADPVLWRPQHGLVGCLMMCGCNPGGVLSGGNQWANQFFEAFHCGGSPQASEHADAADRVAHYVMLPWKLVLAFAPPTLLFGGWLTLIVSLLIIGVLTALLIDAAAMVACLLGISEAIIAFAVIAVGTSVPDLHGTAKAAREQETADDSVNSLFGSVAVNIFLGLGIQFLVGAFYWQTFASDSSIRGNANVALLRHHANHGGTTGSLDQFQYPATDFAFTLGAFLVLLFFVVLHLWGRRSEFGGELGGPKHAQYSSAVFLVWMFVFFLAAVIWRVETAEHRLMMDRPEGFNTGEVEKWEEGWALLVFLLHAFLGIFVTNKVLLPLFVVVYGRVAKLWAEDEVAASVQGASKAAKEKMRIPHVDPALWSAAQERERRHADKQRDAKMEKILNMLGSRGKENLKSQAVQAMTSDQEEDAGTQPSMMSSRRELMTPA
mmetsp:Transcript_3160/g.7392  ORF Transcript_3160/g.7392 Transcript_3160/m.7392 type:complete len:1417 (-) Transcript_3160:521-4771(-)|eukprot:CAMPEP_0179007418 /NCGR_PEP_ID=MMETSP0795-20121207/15150_1 /TAXON_ID=88552 /ORGANISM="Amoebophrya sp., Strain Ameob2" /LENGTH=1416 /DNA_ID=CAMNT_0020702391 /DNA_START=156 /DNA_END=4406 /DNA_ORIENTATION=-